MADLAAITAPTLILAGGPWSRLDQSRYASAFPCAGRRASDPLPGSVALVGRGLGFSRSCLVRVLSQAITGFGAAGQPSSGAASGTAEGTAAGAATADPSATPSAIADATSTVMTFDLSLKPRPQSSRCRRIVDELSTVAATLGPGSERWGDTA
ncbi:hypothetical protein [Amycolatopsis sp. NPDC004378]